MVLDINTRTYRSTYLTLNNQRRCVLHDHCLGVEYLDTVSSESLTIFRRRLKTELFSHSFPI